MARLQRFGWVLVLALAFVPTGLRAQEPKDNKWTKDATKYLTLAELKQKPEEKQDLYNQALQSLQEGMQKEPDNAKVWLLAGQVYAGLDRYAAADSAFDKAVQLYPDYKDEVTPSREQAWLKAFQAGASAMDAQKPDSAIYYMEKAETIYDARPEAELNLGMLYANNNKPEQARAAFRTAIERLNGPLRDKLKPEDQAQWKQYEAVAKMNLAQMDAQDAITAFNADSFTVAAAEFRKALEVNPYSRDYAYNLAQSIYSEAQKIDEQRKAAKPADQAQYHKQLEPLFRDLIAITRKVQAMDPNNTELYLMVGRAYRGLALAATSPGAKKALQDSTLAVLTKAQALPFEVTDVSLTPGADTVKVAGKVKNHSLKAGDVVKLRFSFLGLDGKEVGSDVVTVTLNAPDRPAAASGKAPAEEPPAAEFQASIPITAQMAGWKYSVEP